jgi:hypothetical protein
MRIVLRVALPDRPGALAEVAAAVGGCGADIAALEVVARADGVAVDDLCLDSPVGPQRLRSAVERVAGARVEAVRGVERFRDLGAPVALAAALAEAAEPEARLGALLAGLPHALWATWAAAVRTDAGALRVLGAHGGVPDLDGGPSSWLPLRAGTALGIADVLRPEQRAAAQRAGLAVAAAPLGQVGAILLARVGGPAFRPAEVRCLAHLTTIAGRVGALLSAPAGRAATAGRS